MRLLVVVLALLFMSAALAEEKEEKEGESETGAKYIEMEPKFTVNLAEPKRLLLIDVQLLVEGEKPIEAVKKHMPALRHELIMLYSGKPSAELQTMEQREALRQETTAIVRQTLEKMEGGKHHDASADKGHGEEHKAEPAKEGHAEEGKVEPTEGFKEAYFTEFLVE